MKEILNQINKKLNYVKFNLDNKAVNNFVIDCIMNKFNKSNSMFNELQKKVESDLLSNNSINIIILDDVAELNKQLNLLVKTCTYFFGDDTELIEAIKSLKKDIGLFKATIKTLGIESDTLED